MSASVKHEENVGIRDPYRTLLILLGGLLMALVALAGQMGGKDDSQVQAGQSRIESNVRLEGPHV
jgi:hypothetical protein